MIPNNLNRLLTIERGWALHAIPVPGRGLAVFLTHSDHHPAETRWAECEFIQNLQEGLDQGRIDTIDHWNRKHNSPFFIYCSSLNNGITCIDSMIDNAEKNKTFDEDLRTWKKFLDKFMYK